MINTIINYLYNKLYSLKFNNINSSLELQNLNISNISDNSTSSNNSDNSNVFSALTVSNDSITSNESIKVNNYTNDKKEIINLLNQHCTTKIDNNINLQTKNILYSRLIISNIICLIIGYTYGKKNNIYIN